MAFTIHTPVTGLELLPSGGRGAGEVQTVSIFAYRDIVTEAGHIKAGSVGFVTKAWINKIIAGQCACKGSLSWFKFL